MLVGRGGAEGPSPFWFSSSNAVATAIEEGGGVCAGPFDIPGVANPITGSAIQAEGLTIAAKVKAKEKFCADFSTKLIKPYTSDVVAECLFLNLAEGAAIPDFTDDEVNCP